MIIFSGRLRYQRFTTYPGFREKRPAVSVDVMGVEMVVATIASFVLIGLVCGFYVSIVGFLIVTSLWFAVVAMASAAGMVEIENQLTNAMIALVLAQCAYLAGAAIASKLRSAVSGLVQTGCSHGIEPGTKNSR